MKIFLTLFCSLLCATAAEAQMLDQTFKDWSLFRHQQSCYIASAPKSHTGTFRKRGQPYVMIVHKSATTDEINASSGFPFLPKSDALATIGGKQYKLYTQNNVAWAYDATEDATLVAAMKQADTLAIRGTSPRRTWAEDTYSLAGFNEAYARMKVLCK